MKPRRKKPEFWKKGKGWKNFLPSDWKIALIISICLFGSWAYIHDTKEYREFYETVARDPCVYCSVCNPEVGKWTHGSEWPMNGSLVPLDNITVY